MPRRTRRSLSFALAVTALLRAGCGAEESITLNIPQPLSAAVGRDLELPLHAYAADQQVRWSWASRTNPGLATRKRRPTLTEYTRGTAVWRWQPTAEDLGEQEIEFTAQAGGARAAQVLRFTVDEGAMAPAFRAPFGEGTTLDLGLAPCAVIPVLVESTASPRVELSLVTPPPNATLTQDGPLAGTLRFCPTTQQFMAEAIYPLHLQAAAMSDTIDKIYVIVLRKTP